MKKLLLLTAAGLILQATPVLAEHHGDKHGGKKGQMFAKYDTNGDGAISEAEFLEKAKKKFAEKDTNGDGAISQDEAKAAHKEKRGARKEKRQERRENRKEKRSLNE